MWIVQRDFSAEWERRARYDRDELTVYLRVDHLVQHTDGVVKATDVSVWSEHGFYGAS